MQSLIRCRPKARLRGCSIEERFGSLKDKIGSKKSIESHLITTQNACSNCKIANSQGLLLSGSDLMLVKIVMISNKQYIHDINYTF